MLTPDDSNAGTARVWEFWSHINVRILFTSDCGITGHTRIRDYRSSQSQELLVMKEYRNVGHVRIEEYMSPWCLGVSVTPDCKVTPD